ncbi:hypothetical protein [Flammeovirga sp. SJP92]|uniref:hypothetical protein n=1 Tax=Flammeovirga sp. SJP92 TaxID=1775430 RepID=UPI000787FBCE|nr:hypothetical protein [Flammeovirga sp. SJP92]KXX68645.1 hypothetical protein AVL50_23080 [Flammeovirga sp. SJP92]
MKSNFMLLLLALFANSVFAQSSKHWTIYGNDFVYQNGKYSQDEKLTVPLASHVSSLKRLKDGRIFGTSQQGAILVSNGQVRNVKAHEFSSEEHGDPIVNLENFVRGYKPNPDFHELMDLKSAGWDTEGNLYIPDVKMGLRIMKEAGVKGKYVAIPDTYKSTWALYNIVGLDKGFIAGLSKVIKRKDGSSTEEYRFVYFNGTDYKIEKLPKEPSENDKNPLMSAASEREHILTDIFKDKKGRYWVTGKNKVFLFKEGQLEEQFSIKTDNIKAFAVNDKGEALIDMASGNVVVYDINAKKIDMSFKKSKTIICGTLSSSYPKITDIEVDDKNRFVIATANVSTKYNRKNKSFIEEQTFNGGAVVILDLPTYQSESSLKILNSYTDKDEKFLELVGQDHLNDDLGNQYILAVNGESIRKIDAQGNTKEFTIEDLTKKAGYKYPDFKIYTSNWSIDKKSGALYITTPTRKLTFKMKADESVEQITFVLDKKLGGKSAKLMVYDNVNDALWLATGKGYVYHPMNGGEIKYFTKKETGLGTGYGLFQMRMDEKGTLWVSNSKGVGAFTKDGFKVYENPKEGNLSNFIIEDYNGVANCIGGKGVAQIKDGAVNEITSFQALKEALDKKFPDAPNSTMVKKACFDKENQLWVATKDNIIGHFDGTNWEVFTLNKFYTDEDVFDIFLDRNDRVNIVIAKMPAPVITTPTQTAAAAEAAAKETVGQKFEKKVNKSIYFESTVVLVDKNNEN